MLSQEHSFFMDMTVLERQQARLKWSQQHSNYVCQNVGSSIEPCPIQQLQDFFDHAAAVNGDGNWKRKPEMDLAGNGFEFGGKKIDSFVAEGTSCLEIDHCLSRTSSCQKGSLDVARVEKEMMVAEFSDEDEGLMDKVVQPINAKDCKNKREAEISAAENRNEKRSKREAEVDSKVKEKTSTENSMDSFKEVPKKPDFIHVRARRGQATDSHSLAERARREKISKKMKCLQDLVPGCNKITGRAGMLDEIINYVQSLQRQVEFLSMKLAALTPRIESSTDNFSVKEFPAYAANYQLHHLQVQQEATGSEQEALTADRTATSSAFMSALDSSCFSVQPFWDPDLQNLHNVGFHQA